MEDNQPHKQNFRDNRSEFQKYIEDAVKWFKAAKGLVDQGKITTAFLQYEKCLKTKEAISFPKWLKDEKILDSFILAEIKKRLGTLDQSSDDIEKESISEDINQLTCVDSAITDFIETPLFPSLSHFKKESTPVKKKIGRYELLNLIGRGGMGEVYLAKDTTLGRHVALKKIFLATGNQDEKYSLERFRQEAKAAAQLNHPNIVTIYDFGEDGKEVYLSMELIEGISLKEYLQKNRLGIEQIIAIMTKIGQAVHYAHGKNIIHRDLKPENIMLDGNLSPKIMDFGLAKIKDTPELTQTGQILGTPRYMSPEQALGEKSVDNRADVFAMGILLYEMLTAQIPFQASIPSAVCYQVVHVSPPPPSSINPEVPQEIEKICMKALEKDKNHRYQSAEKFVQDLQNFAQKKDEQPSAENAAAKQNRRRTGRITSRTERKKEPAGMYRHWLFGAVFLAVLAGGIFLLFLQTEEILIPQISFEGKILKAKEPVLLSSKNTIQLIVPALHYCYCFRYSSLFGMKDKKVQPMEQYFTRPQYQKNEIHLSLKSVISDEYWFLALSTQKLSHAQIEKVRENLSAETYGVLPFHSPSEDMMEQQFYFLDTRPQGQVSRLLARVKITDNPFSIKPYIKKKNDSSFQKMDHLDVVTYGDRLQLHIKIYRDTHLAIFLCDSARQISTLYPLDGQKTDKLTANSSLVIPCQEDGFVFDNSNGQESLCYFSSPNPLDCENLKKWLSDSKNWSYYAQKQDRGVLPYEETSRSRPPADLKIVSFQHE